MNMTRSSSLLRLLWSGILAVSVCLGGCSFKQAYPAKETFLIEARRVGEAKASSHAMPLVLRARNLQVSAPFEGKGFVYRGSGLRYETDFYHEFLVAPRALLTEQVRQWLGASGVVGVVIDSASKADATHLLDGHVSALYGDYRELAAPIAVLAIEFFLSREQSASGEIIFHHRYRQEVSIENHNAETLAQGWGRALEQILAALEQDLAKALAK